MRQGLARSAPLCISFKGKGDQPGTVVLPRSRSAGLGAPRFQPRLSAIISAVPSAGLKGRFSVADAVSGHRIVPERETLIEAGDRVRVLTGPFAGIEGVAVPRRGRRRLLVSWSTVAEGLTVDLDGASLQVIAAAGPRPQAPAPCVAAPVRASRAWRSSRAAAASWHATTPKPAFCHRRPPHPTPPKQVSVDH
jgi:hypothetical protein